MLDVGAFIGDTPLYFGMKGASHVFAYEAATPLCKIALENIQLNGMKDRITLENKVVVTNPQDVVSFHFDENWLRSSSLYSGTAKTKILQVQGITLGEILKETGDIGLLKMDIEGGEHKIVSKACKQRILKQVESIIMEIHGVNGKLIRLLQADGYEVNILRRFSSSLSLVSAIRKR